jgi:hypothetical protein
MRNRPSKLHWQLKEKITKMSEITEKMKGNTMSEYNGCTIEKNYDSLCAATDYLWSVKDFDLDDECGTGCSVEHCQEQIDDLIIEGVI